MQMPLCTIPACLLAFSPGAKAELRVAIDFPGGSAEVVRVDEAARLIRLRPSPHPGRGWQCWWYFRVGGIQPGETLTLEVEGGVWAWPERAAFQIHIPGGSTFATGSTAAWMTAGLPEATARSSAAHTWLPFSTYSPWQPIAIATWSYRTGA